jgi:hypothetical protein
MAKKPLPDQELLKQLLDYDPATGALTWKSRPAHMFSGAELSREHAAAIWNSKFAGKRALTAAHGSGYRHGRIGDVDYMTHRIIWKLVHGVDPDVVDHINGQKADNRIANLRSVSVSQNARNMPRLSNNTSGHTGVHLCRKTGRWRAELIAEGKHIRLGRFDTLEAAATARREAALAHGFHENHGR